MPENDPTLEQPAERRAVTPAMVRSRQTTRGPRQPFTANVPRDPVCGLSPRDGSPKEPRRIESARVAAVRWSPDRTKGVIGIEMPLRSIEDVAHADGARRD